MSSLAERLRAARVVRGLGVNALDRLAELSPGTVSRLENAKRGKAGGYGETISKLERALACRRGFLLNGGPMEPEPPRPDDPIAQPTVRLGDQPGYDEAEVEARAIAKRKRLAIPEELWAHARRLVMPRPLELDGAFVLDLVKLLRDHPTAGDVPPPAPPPKSRAA